MSAGAKPPPRLRPARTGPTRSTATGARPARPARPQRTVGQPATDRARTGRTGQSLGAERSVLSGSPAATSPRPSRAVPGAPRRLYDQATSRRRFPVVSRGRLMLLVALVVALVGGVAWALYFSSWLTVEDVRVEGVTTLSAEDVLAAADVAVGAPLARVDTSDVAARVEALAPVDTVSLRRAWPDTLVIAVDEREPVLVVAAADGFGVYDAGGVEFLSPAAAPPGVPVLRAAGETPTPEVLDAVISVVADLPASLGDRLGEVTAPTPASIQLQLIDGIVIEWGSATDNARKAEVLTELMKQPGRVYIVSAPEVPAIRT